MRKLLISLLLTCSISLHLAAQTLKGKVISIKDGDTIELLVNNKPVRIRLHGIDCPEKKQPFGQKARQFTSDLCFGKIVRAEKTDKDRYGRTVAKVYLPSGELLNTSLLKAGLAWHYTKYDKSEDFALAEKDAKARKKGIWADDHTIAPWDWRKGAR
jgi:endonuclease YncB( thermonuclease family)